MPALAAPRRLQLPARPGAQRGGPQLRVVASPRHTARWVVLLVAVAAAGVFGSVSLSALAAEQSFAARALQADIAELTYRYEELTAEVAALESPARVRRVAEHDLGMVPAEQPAYLVIEAGPALVPVAHVEDAAGDPAGPLADPLKPVLGAGH